MSGVVASFVLLAALMIGLALVTLVAVLAAGLKQAFESAVTKLSERERTIIALYYVEELSLKEIGGLLGVTESRVSQLHTKAILRLKARLAGSARAVLET